MTLVLEYNSKTKSRSEQVSVVLRAKYTKLSLRPFLLHQGAKHIPLRLGTWRPHRIVKIRLATLGCLGMQRELRHTQQLKLVVSDTVLPVGAAFVAEQPERSQLLDQILVVELAVVLKILSTKNKSSFHTGTGEEEFD